MFIDRILDAIFRPFRELYARWVSVRAIQSGIQGDVRRVRSLGYQAQAYQQQAAQLPGQVAQGVNSAQQKSKKMSWFSFGKKNCPRCNNKLHKSWDQCPYCGMDQRTGQQAPLQQQPPQQPVGMPQQQPLNPGRTVLYDPGAAPPVIPQGPGENVAWLVPLEGPQAGVPMQIRGRVVIGTAEGCDIRMADPAISGRHAEIAAAGRSFRVTDLGSTNHTYVNNRPITSVELVDNDDIRLGRTSFRFKTKS